ncbi:hypothetical protein Glove_242g32 [Diversispora epigaea]|uniref:Tyr recombinase domain-containing protein n=1 Tax=Diversispora epigaea TaxID=1348612 RepID=A0A397IIJ1_9GLOM|nr:hypothetical protein Glove_242g32 [Diversispora epigaea]
MFQSALSILQNKNNNIIIHEKAEENKEKKNEKDEKTKKKETKVERELNNKIEFYIQKGTVKNTLRSTRNWISKLEVFRKSHGYDIPIEMVTDTQVLQKQIVEYIASMKRLNGQEYKANTLKVALDSINRYLIKESKIHGVNLHNRYEFPEIHDVLHGKMKDLQKRGLGEIHGSQALNTEQVQHILNHESMSIITSENLLYRVFFRMAIIFACRGGEHYHIKANQLQRREDKGFNFIRYSAKNNQRGINRGNAQIIPIPADHLGTFDPCYDFQLYLSKRPIGSDENLYLQVNPKWQESGIWFKKNHYGSNKLSKFMKKICQRTHVSIPENFLSNHSGRKTATQILHDNDIPEQTIMEITGHCSIQGVRAYKKTNEHQKMMGISSLLSLYDPHLSSSQEILSTNEINSSNTSQEIQSINFSHEFQSTDSSQEDNSNNIGKENQNKMPIFSNCNFSNVTFNFK